MSMMDESLASIEQLLQELSKNEETINDLVNEEFEKLLAENNIRTIQNSEEIKSKIAEKYREMIREKIIKLEFSKNILLNMKNRYGNLVNNI